MADAWNLRAPLAVYQYAVGRVEMEARPQETWTGAVDI
jgi:hypothetical protein